MNLKIIGFLLAMAGISLFAETSITDGELKAQFEKGNVKIFYQKGQKLAMTLSPEPAIPNVYADTAEPRKGQKALIVRGTNGSYAVILTDKTLQVTGSSGIKALNISIKTEAVVLPDALAEDDVIVPQTNPLRVPNFLPYFRVLANDSDLIVNCIRSARPSDISFCKGKNETLFRFPQSNGENMIFTFLTGKGVWTKVNDATTEFKTLDWKPPFPACYVASFKAKDHRIGFSLLEPNNNGYNYRTSLSFVTIGNLNKPDPPSWWTSVLSHIAYPFVKSKTDVVRLRIPSKGRIKPGDFPPDTVYIYAYGAIILGIKTVPATPKNQVFPVANPTYFPQKYLPLYARGPFARSRTFTFPPTCASTNRVEAAFMKGTVKKDAAELRNQLNRMDLFQAGIRARVEQYMRWSEDMKIILQMLPDYQKEYAPLLEQFRKIYDSFAPRMKKVQDCHALSLKMRNLIDAKGDEEQLEEEAKKLGRAIRGMGSAQDACLGNMRTQAKKIRAKLLHSYVYGKPDKLLDWNISVAFDDMDRLFNGYIGMEGK